MGVAQSRIELSKRAARDLRKLDARDRRRIVDNVLPLLVPIPRPENLDVESIVAHDPWLRLRAGDWRVIYRPLTRRELRFLAQRDDEDVAPAGYLIERVVDRQYLERAVKTLELKELA
jgi:mRNA-degrading endonuclease RelE of RelBE toxin-antitoxin system